MKKKPEVGWKAAIGHLLTAVLYALFKWNVIGESKGKTCFATFDSDVPYNYSDDTVLKN